MNAYELMVKIGLDSSQFNKDLNAAGEQTKSFGSKVGTAFKAVGAVAAAGLGAASAAIGYMTKAALAGYSTHEQMVGGVKKLYGNAGMSVQDYAKSVGKSVNDVKGEWSKLEKAQNTVIKNADNAYKTAGMSANDYMNTATQFSASLISSLSGDTQKAADLTDKAMRDMSDNINTFGSNAEDVQNAYKGFAKQNYTMLDNLKLGYGGTKTEMQRLVADAAKATDAQKELGLSVDANSLSFANVVKAIEVVQKEQGIYGTTSREAATTVEGSINMTRAAWDNLLAGLGDKNADMSQLIDNLVSSASTAAKNVMPVVEQAIAGIGNFITQIAPMVVQLLPQMVSEIAPPLLSAAGQLVGTLISALPGIIQSLIDVLPGIAKTIWDSFSSAFDKLIGDNRITEVINNELIPAFEDIAYAVADIVGPIGEFFSKLASNTDIVGAISTAISVLADMIARIADILPGLIPIIAGVGAAITAAKIISTVQSVIALVPQVVSGVNSVVQTFNAVRLGLGGVSGVIGALASPVGIAVVAIGALVAAGVALYMNWDKIKGAAKTLGSFLSGVWQGIASVASSVWNGITSTLSSIWNGISSTASSVFGTIASVIGGVWESISSAASTAWNTITNVVQVGIMLIQEIISAAAQILLIPWNFIWENFGSQLTAAWSTITSTISGAISAIQGIISGAWSVIQSVTSTVWGAISGAISRVWSAISRTVGGAVSKVSGVISKAWNTIKSVTTTVWNAIKSAITTVWNGINSVVTTAVNVVKGVITSVWNGIKGITSTVWGAIKTAISTPINAAKGVVQSATSAMKGFMQGLANNPISSIFGSILSSIRSKMDAAKKAVGDAIQKIKNKFNFHWSLPSLKLPHPSVSGKFSLDPPSVPHFSLKWYKKAMENPYMFGNHAVLFGAGDAGDEIMYGRQNLLNDMQEALRNVQSSAPQVTINVYGAQGQDVNELAEIVMDKMNRAVNRQKAVFA